MHRPLKILSSVQRSDTGIFNNTELVLSLHHTGMRQRNENLAHTAHKTHTHTRKLKNKKVFFSETVCVCVACVILPTFLLFVTFTVYCIREPCVSGDGFLIQCLHFYGTELSEMSSLVGCRL